MSWVNTTPTGSLYQFEVNNIFSQIWMDEVTITEPQSAGQKGLKVHKTENFFDSDFGICVFSLLIMSKY